MFPHSQVESVNLYQSRYLVLFVETDSTERSISIFSPATLNAIKSLLLLCSFKPAPLSVLAEKNPFDRNANLTLAASGPLKNLDNLYRKHRTQHGQLHYCEKGSQRCYQCPLDSSLLSNDNIFKFPL